MSGTLHSLHNTPSYRGPHLKKEAQGQLTLLYFTYFYKIIKLY